MDRAAQYYDLACDLRSHVLLYHSRFTEPHKAQKERRVRQMLGRDGTGGLVVMTQIGEMSLNISAPVMVSELCPIDRLAQRTGRMSRFEGGQGALHLIVPTRDGELYPAPYGTPERGRGWVPSDALLATRERLEEGQRLTKRDLTELTNDVYDEPVQYSRAAQSNAERLARDCRQQWLIVPEATVEADDTSAPEWTSRMIGSQVDVFTSIHHVQDTYEGYRAFQEAQMQHVISVPTYRYRQHTGRFTTREVTIGPDDTEVVHALTEPTPYDEETGLIFE